MLLLARVRELQLRGSNLLLAAVKIPRDLHLTLCARSARHHRAKPRPLVFGQHLRTRLVDGGGADARGAALLLLARLHRRPQRQPEGQATGLLLNLAQGGAVRAADGRDSHRGHADHGGELGQLVGDLGSVPQGAGLGDQLRQNGLGAPPLVSFPGDEGVLAEDLHYGLRCRRNLGHLPGARAAVRGWQGHDGDVKAEEGAGRLRRVSLSKVSVDLAVHEGHGSELRGCARLQVPDEDEAPVRQRRLLHLRGGAPPRRPHIDRRQLSIAAAKPLDQHGALGGETRDARVEPRILVADLHRLPDGQSERLAELDLLRVGPRPRLDGILLLHVARHHGELLEKRLRLHHAGGCLRDLHGLDELAVPLRQCPHLEGLAGERRDQRAEDELGAACRTRR
mmetsp:Transcript_78499/g.208438  ORF Transcript_78499/g.208438 Transcript_78499/m.208438 type:complete len:395 (+) Transcript_78499:1111-2295(+)